jgi:hypothetical protein
MKKQHIRMTAGLLLATTIALVGINADAAFVINHNLNDPQEPNIPESNAIYLGAFANGPTGAAEVQAFLDSISSPITLGALLYKVNNEGGEEDLPLMNSYETSPVPWSTDEETEAEPIKIEHLGGMFAGASVLVIKDGNLGSVVFDISDWNGTDDLLIYNVFDPSKVDLGGTSHIEFFGTAVVPEPATVVAGALLLLPFGASMVRILRKKREV